MNVKAALVTGAGGFIGRWSVPALLSRGFDVHAVVGRPALPSSPVRPVPEPLRGATLHAIDLFDPTATRELLAAVQPTHLLHFAWIATPGVYWTSDDNYRWRDASVRLLDAFRAVGGERVVMAGTSAEYDWSRAGVCDEATTPLVRGDLTPYADCKLELQRRLASMAEGSRVSAGWGRVFFQYGPDEHPHRLVASVVTQLLRGEEARCSHGRQVRSFLHVADVGAAFAALLDSGVEGPVNIGSGDAVAVAAVLDEVALQIGRPELLRLGARPVAVAEPPLLVPAIHRLRDEVGWLPRFDLKTGLADTIAWWRMALAATAPQNPRC